MDFLYESFLLYYNGTLRFQAYIIQHLYASIKRDSKSENEAISFTLWVYAIEVGTHLLTTAHTRLLLGM